MASQIELMNVTGNVNEISTNRKNGKDFRTLDDTNTITEGSVTALLTNHNANAHKSSERLV